MSGSLVFRSGVGTQMLIVSNSEMTLKSVVAQSLPALTSASTSDGATSCTYESPALTLATLDSIKSIPVTENPALAYSTASGRPTYPSPTIPTRAVRVPILLASASAHDVTGAATDCVIKSSG